MPPISATFSADEEGGYLDGVALPRRPRSALRKTPAWARARVVHAAITCLLAAACPALGRVLP